MPYKTIQQNFANGELNPKMQGRADVDMYYKSAQKMRDVVTTPYGGFVRRPGSTKLSELTEAYNESGTKNIKLVPFVFNNEQSYLLALTEGNIDVFGGDILLKTITSTSFTNDNIPGIKFAQTADSCIFVHEDFAPLKLLRQTNSGIPSLDEGATIEDGWLKAKSMGVPARLLTNFNLVASSSQSIEIAMEVKIPTDTSSPADFYFDNTNFGIQAAHNNGWQGNNALLVVRSIGAIPSGGASASVAITEETVFRLLLTRDTSGNFVFSYSTDGGDTYTQVYTFTNSNYTNISNLQPYINLTNSNIQVNLENTYIKVDNTLVWKYGYGGDWFLTSLPLQSVPKYDFNSTNPISGGVAATPDNIDGNVKITLGSSVSANLVGQYFEGNGGRVKITSQNGTVLTGYTEIGFYSNDTISAGSWTYTTSYEPVWSSTRGWPCSVTFHGGRLWFGGSKSRPQTVWGSKVGLFDKFDPTSGYDNDAIEFTLDTRDLNKITDIYSQKNLMIFTLGGEFVCASSFNEPLTPDNINAVLQTSNGSWGKTHPVDIEGTVMFIERKGQGLMAFAASENTTDIYSSANSSLINSHLIKSPVDIAVERNNLTQQTNYVYIVNEDGGMAVVNLLSSQGITGGYTLWKTKGKYKSVCVLPDDTYVAVERNTPSGYKLFLEKVDFNKLADSEEEVGINNSNTFTISRFANQTVDIYRNGAFYASATANNAGVITLPETITGAVTVGLAFRWLVQSNFLEIPQLGVGMSKKKRLATMTVRTLDTPELTVNGETQPGGEGIKDIEFYGIGDWDEKPTWIMQEKNPCKVNVMAVQMNVNFQVAGDEY